MTEIFYVLVILPSIAFVFLILTTFYGTRRAYVAICWIPLTVFLLLLTFQRLLAFDPSQSLRARELFIVVAWASLVQCGLGVTLAIRAFIKKQSFVGLLAASCLALLPFILRK
jgi:hypothetical protein